MPHVNMLEPPSAALLVIDVQEKILAIAGSDKPADVVDRISRLIAAARVFDLPIFVTEQYPRGLGATDPRLAKLLEESPERYEKSTMSCWRDESFKSALQQSDREQIIVCGIEAHVCVQQTVLDLIRMDYQVFVPVDAIASRFAPDKSAALERMRTAGAELLTAEAAIFELVERCDHPRFKDILTIIK